jgi:enolase-phosphatase E1
MKRQGISHVLLDLEGTTCPVSFVAGSLFPYAAKHLKRFVDIHKEEPLVDALL